jgi:hypothetical protein
MTISYVAGKRLLFQPYEYTGLAPYVVEVVAVSQGGADLSNGIRVDASGETTSIGGGYCEAGYVDDCVVSL